MLTADTQILPVNAAGIPDDLKSLAQWVCWRVIERDGKRTKCPIDAKTMRNADVTDPRAWSTFDAALQRFQAGHADGIGFALNATDPFVFIDLDSCRNSSTERLSGLADGLVNRFASWTEVSPSGTGLHIIVRGKLPQGCNRKNTDEGIECYDRARYFCVTGHALRDVGIVDRQTELDVFVAEYLQREQSTRRESTTAPIPPGVDAQRIIDKIRRSRNAAKIISLLEGSTDAHGGDASSADQALANHLSFWCDKDRRLIDEIFRSSGLMRPKWDERRGEKTYGEITISRAVADCGTIYDWDRRQRRKKTPTPTPEPQILSSGPQDDKLPGDLEFGPPIESFFADESTDRKNAEILIELHGPDIRYCAKWKCWLIWTGSHWQRDDTGQIIRKAHAVSDYWFAKSHGIDDQKQKAACIAHAMRSANTRPIESFLKQAQALAAVDVEDLNQHKWLLNVANGTVDLKTGQLGEHRRSDMLTTICPTRFNPDAGSMVWDTFLESLYPDDQAMIDFLQRLFGSALTGEQIEALLPILHGLGANGKSILVNLLLAVLGPHYAMAAPPNLLIDTGQERHLTELADLYSKRFVVTSETGEGRRLKEDLIKQLTGNDVMRARHLYERHFEFRPEFLIVMVTNHRPRIIGNDEGIWRRVKLIPFDRTFRGKDADPHLGSKLAREHEGVLQWLIRGCLEWQSRKGVDAPERVEVASLGYRSENDVVGQFIESECHVGVSMQARFSDLYDAFVKWCDESGENAMSRRKIGQILQERFDKVKNSGIWYRGIGLRS